MRSINRQYIPIVLLVVAQFALFSIGQEKRSSHVQAADNKEVVVESGKEAVILLHGLARTPRSMKPMQKALEAAGYDVHVLAYPTTVDTVAELSDDHLAPLLVSYRERNYARIHFVTHSLGAIVLRQYFTDHELENLGRIVMLGPPNQGSEVVDRLGRFSMFFWINGPAGRQLGTDTNSLPLNLPPPPGEFGVIAGTRTINWFLSSLIPGKDDGKVSIERAKLEGMRDFMTVPVSHPFLMRRRKVIEPVIHFLQHGTFQSETLHQVSISARNDTP